MTSVQALSVSDITSPVTGMFHGGTDWIINQFGLALFQGMLHICLFYTQLFTIFFNDSGVGFYQCYNSFPKQVIFFT
eukprot:403339435